MTTTTVKYKCLLKGSRDETTDTPSQNNAVVTISLLLTLVEVTFHKRSVEGKPVRAELPQKGIVCKCHTFSWGELILIRLR